MVGLTAGPDGLYFTELYRDQDAQSPIDAGARVLRVRYVPPTPTGDFDGNGLWDCNDIDAPWPKRLPRPTPARLT